MAERLEGASDPNVSFPDNPQTVDRGSPFSVVVLYPSVAAALGVGWWLEVSRQSHRDGRVEKNPCDTEP